VAFGSNRAIKPLAVRVLADALAAAACLVAAIVFERLRIPLAWMLGPICAMGVMTSYRAPGRPVAGARQLGQLVLAIAMGQYFTAEVVTQVASQWRFLILAVVSAVVLAIAGAWAMKRFARVDAATAIFSCAPGGAMEMTVLAERYRAQVDLVALGQTLRVFTVVVAVPFALAATGHTPSWTPPTRATPDLMNGVLAVITCAAFALIAQRMRLPNAWMLAPLALTISFTLAGVYLPQLPGWALNGGQLFIGAALGSKFIPGFFKQAPRFITTFSLVTLASLLFTWALAQVWSIATGGTLGTGVLALSPGGVAEMCITAKVLGLGVPLVTAAQVLRVVAMVVLVEPTYRLFVRKDSS